MPSTVTLHLPFAIMCMSSIPPKMTRAQRKLLNPSIGRTMRLIARWSCSTTLFRYFDCRILIGTSRSALIAFSPQLVAGFFSAVFALEGTSGKGCLRYERTV